MLVFHDEPENAAAGAAAETMKSLPARAHHERRRLFLMKRAERPEIRSRAFHGEIRADHFNDVVRSSDLLDCFRRDRSHAPAYFCLVWALKRWQTYAVQRRFQLSVEYWSAGAME